MLALVAGPTFSWNHHRLMREFATGLVTHLHARLVTVDNRTGGRRVDLCGYRGLCRIQVAGARPLSPHSRRTKTPQPR